MTIFKEKLDEEYVTVSEVKELLAEVEAERAADPDREMRYELEIGRASCRERVSSPV